MGSSGERGHGFKGKEDSQPSDHTPRLLDTGGEAGEQRPIALGQFCCLQDCKLTCILGAAAWGTKPGRRWLKMLGCGGL